MTYQIQLRNDTANNWADINPILAQGEPGYENDTGKIKYGTGTAPWSSLPYFNGGGTGGNATPGGPSGAIQFNANGSFSGSSFFTADSTNSIVTTNGTIEATYFIGDGSQLTNLPSGTSYSNANVAQYLPIYNGNISVDYITGNADFLNLTKVSGNIIPSANTIYSLGNATNQWNELWVSNSTIYLGGIPMSVSSANTLTFDGNELISQSNTGITNLSNLEVTGTAIIPDLSSNTIIANFIAGDGSQITNIQYTNVIGAYGDSNVAVYLPTNNANVSANYFIGDGSQLTNLPVLDAYSNANVAAYLPTYTGPLSANSATLGNSVLANYFIGDGSLLTNLPVLDAYSNANVAAYLPTYTGNIESLTGNVVTIANIQANYVLGNAAFMTGIDAAMGYSNANVANFLPVYSGNINALTVTANVVTANTVSSIYEMTSERTSANTILFGNSSVTVSTQSWAVGQSNSLSNVVLYQVDSSNISSIDFNVTATSGNNRQVTKITAVTINSSYDYNEYGSLAVGSLLGNFFVDLNGSNIQLVVEPLVSNLVSYTVVYTLYNTAS